MFSRTLHRRALPHRLLTNLRSRPFTSTYAHLERQVPPSPVAPRAPPTSRRSNSSQLPFLSLVAIFCLGSGSFYFLTKARAGQTPANTYELPQRDSGDKTMAPIEGFDRTSPLFTPGTSAPNQALVLFVLGGPGAGKGTQCANLVRDYGFTHLSAGDLLREEQNRPGSDFGEMIKTYIKEGQIVPMEVTIKLLENAMVSEINKTGNRKFLIDGFPRKMDQAVKFEEIVVPSKFTLFFDCPEETMRERLLNRGKTSGRADDNEESIKKRFRTFVETSMPVVEAFEKEGRVVKLDARPEPEQVYRLVQEELGKRGLQPSKETDKSAGGP